MRIVPDFSWAVMTIWQEARGEPYAGKVAVGNVIRNRMRGGKSAAEVVLAPYQFSGWNTNDPNRIPAAMIDDTDMIVHECAQAWLASENMLLVGLATLYANLDVCTPTWLDKATEVIKIGHHTFFTEA